MAQDPNTPKPASNKSKAEGERWKSDPDTIERRYRDAGADQSEAEGGITNRPLDEEVENQNSLPDRGGSKEGAHAGHGGGKRTS